MLSKGIKLLGLLILVVSLVVTMSACDMEDPPPDEEPATHTLTLMIAGEGQIYLNDEKVDIENDSKEVEAEEGVHDIKAVPGDNWKFKQWEDDVADTDSVETTVTMDSDKSVTAVFEKESLTITNIEEIPDKTVEFSTEFEDIDLPEDVEVTLDDNTTTNLDVNWLEGDYDGETADTYTIVGELELTDDIINPDNLYPTVQVAVQEEDIILYTVSVDYDDDKGTVTGDGDYEEGEEVELTATAKEGYKFAEWTGYVADTANTIIFDMPKEDVELTAVFEKEEIEPEEYELTINIEGEGNTIPEEGIHKFEEGTTVDLEAIPDEGWKFDYWEGNVDELDSIETTIVMKEDESVTAHFEEEPPTKYELKLIGKNITSEPAEGKIEEGTEVMVEVEPEEGKQVEIFEVNEENKKDDLMEAPEYKYIFTITEDTTVEVTYEDIPPEKYDLTIDVEGEGSTEPEPGTHEYEEGTTVNIEAIPADNWEFKQWTGDVDSTDKEISVYMDGDKSVTAHFEQKLAYFAVEITDYPEEVTGEGADIEVEYSIENTGDVEDIQDIIFSVNETEVDSAEITLAAGEVHDSEFSYETKSEDVGEELNIKVASDNDKEEKTIVIKGFAGGSGTENDPYLVENAIQLDYVREHLDAHFKQINDIDLSSYFNWEPIGEWFGEGYSENKPFTGTFKGNGYSIKNLTMNYPENDKPTGLIQYTDKESYLSGIFLKNIDIHGDKMVGGLVGYNLGTIENSSVEGDVSGRRFQIGGIVGNNQGTIKNIDSDVEIKGNRIIGGFIGYNQGEVFDCQTKAIVNISGLSANANSIGGFIGTNHGSVMQSYVETKINAEGANVVGGFIGNNYANISDSSAKVEVNGHITIGGFIGYNRSSGNIFNCKVEGNVEGNHRNIGGLVGNNEGGLSNTSALVDVIGRYNVGGLVGNNSSYMAEISNSYAQGNIKGETSYIGGVIGNNRGDIKNVYFLGKVEGTEVVGGLVGINSSQAMTTDAEIKNSYASGNIIGEIGLGGLVGVNEEDGVVHKSYYDKNTTNQDDEGKGIPKTTEEMMQQDTFTPEWDFDTIWEIDEGNSYPYFQWQEGENIPVPPDN